MYEGDLVHALSVSLGQAKIQSVSHKEKEQKEEEKFNTALTETCLKLNAKCHASIKTLIKKNSLNPHLIENVNLEHFVQEIDPDIWKALCILTQPLSSKSQKVTTDVRKLRRIYSSCTLFFTINHECSFPLHTLITDIIEARGGFENLVQFLNRLGACASIETHNRYSEYRVEKRKEDRLLSGYSSDAFMMVSDDNIDFINSYAQVYQQTSWHGPQFNPNHSL